MRTLLKLVVGAVWLAGVGLRPLGAQISVAQVNSLTTLGDMRSVLNALPACSNLLDSKPGTSGAPSEPAYMPLMRKLGVARALIAINGFAEENDIHLHDLQMGAQLYFAQYDGPDTQIRDPAKLAAIRASGLEGELSQIAIAQAESADSRPLGFDAPNSNFSNWYGEDLAFYGYFVSDDFMPPRDWPGVAPRPLSGSLDWDASVGNLAGVMTAVQAGGLSPGQLDRALFNAVSDRFDNDAVMRVLVRAGANPNAPMPSFALGSPAGTPLLFAALDSPCNLQNLIRLGADPSVRDFEGKTVLQRAIETGSTRSAAALRSAIKGGH